MDLGCVEIGEREVIRQKIGMKELERHDFLPEATQKYLGSKKSRRDRTLQLECTFSALCPIPFFLYAFSRVRFCGITLGIYNRQVPRLSVLKNFKCDFRCSTFLKGAQLPIIVHLYGREAKGRTVSVSNMPSRDCHGAVEATVFRFVGISIQKATAAELLTPLSLIHIIPYG